MDDKELAWEEIETEHIVEDEWIDFRKSTYRYPDGRVFSPYYSYSRRDYTVIVASDENGHYLCVRQFRQGIKEVTTEFPAGGIERTDGKEYGSRDAAEAALDCAKRELREETGYESDEWSRFRCALNAESYRASVQYGLIFSPPYPGVDTLLTDIHLSDLHFLSLYPILIIGYIQPTTDPLYIDMLFSSLSIGYFI